MDRDKEICVLPVCHSCTLFEGDKYVPFSCQENFIERILHEDLFQFQGYIEDDILLIEIFWSNSTGVVSAVSRIKNYHPFDNIHVRFIGRSCFSIYIHNKSRRVIKDECLII